MIRILFVLFALFLIAAPGNAPLSIAAEPAKTAGTSAETEATRAEELVKSSELFRQAAKKAVAESDIEEAKSYLKKSNDAFTEGIADYGTGKYKESLEALSNSTHFAILAIVTVKKHQTSTAKPPAISTAESKTMEQAKSRKKAKAEHDIGDVETFIGVLKRLLAEKDDQAGRKSLDEAIKAYESAIKNSKSENYDKAIADANAAYRIATSAITDIKISRAEVVIYPKKNLGSEEDTLEYELKKNDTYIYFAKLMTTDKNNTSDKSMQAGEKQRADALAAAKTGDTKKAIDLLRASTNSCIDAIRNNSTTKP